MIKVLTCIICWLLLAIIVSGCGGSGSLGVTRTVVSERLVTRIDSPKTIRPLIYSPDARRVAYVSETNGTEYIVVDGVSGKGYDSIDINSRSFSPDTKRVAYVAVILGENLRQATSGLLSLMEKKATNIALLACSI